MTAETVKLHTTTRGNAVVIAPTSPIYDATDGVVRDNNENKGLPFITQPFVLFVRRVLAARAFQPITQPVARWFLRLRWICHAVQPGAEWLLILRLYARPNDQNHKEVFSISYINVIEQLQGYHPRSQRETGWPSTEHRQKKFYEANMISGNLPRLIAAAMLIVGLAGCSHTNEAGHTEGSVEMYGTIDVGVGSTSTP